MTHNEVRQKFIEFFKKRNHKEIPTASLVPENDPTSLFTSSGMQPLITYLLGEKHPLGTRLVDSQKCFRSQDIEEIGDNRHTTFFEMLGNWSLGDYFKKEQITWIFSFLINELHLSPSKLYVTIFKGTASVPRDSESELILLEQFNQIQKEFIKIGDVTINYEPTKGIKKTDRIFYYGVEKNWWSRSGTPDKMPVGEPGGPDCEIFYDFGEELRLHENSSYKDKPCHPNCDCGRFMEIANSVFMEFQKQPDGFVKPLKQQNVDFGGGLERMVAVTNNNPDVFQTDLYSEILKTIEDISGKKYSDDENKPSIRVIADHLKAATFIALEGIEPDNKKQGYILRRLLRRSAIKLRLLTNLPTTQHQFLPIVESVLDTYKNTPYFNNINIDSIKDLIGPELLKFTKSLDKGLREVQKYTNIDGKIAFDLYQTYGFPLEITAELFAQKGQKIDIRQFEVEFNEHRNISRTAAKGMFKGGLQDQSEITTKLHTATHLLQQALITVLGIHVHQKGSNITAERLRFDFSHPQKLTADEIKKVEELINKKIEENLAVSMEIMDLKEAIHKEALTVPDAKYPEKVKVYSVGKFSKEVCGGPHVNFTGSLGTFKIIKEDAAASNVRRIYAVLTK